jgi:DNA (cytosine-5)-methyltransferase 1
LHSYPDWFRFHVTKWHGFRQIGNSVPPLLARAIASKVREAFPVPKKSDHPVVQGDLRLLSLDMSNAAARYGVRADVIPKRIRVGREGESNG